MSKIKDKQIDYQNKIELANECGLIHTGEYEDGSPQFLGDNKAWSLFNDGGL